MKKLNATIGVLLLFTGLIVLSCSSDDNNNETTNKQELLIGKWKKIKIGTICSSGNETSENYSTCKQKGTITFNENGTYNDIPYIEYNNECIIDGESNGVWKIMDDDLYIKNDGSTSFIKATLFEISKNSLKLGGDSDPCDGEENPSIEYLEYSKVE